MRRRDGQWCWTLGRGMLVSRDAEGRPLRLVGTNTDITERKRLEARLHELAFEDTLTRLPNRRLLLDRLAHALATSQRTGRRGALMFLDLDNFKALNDTAGHVVGDRLLIEVARRLKHSVREMDTVARLGGDEFVVMVSDLDGARADAAEHVLGIARKIRQALSEPYRLAEPPDDPPEAEVLRLCTASIGLALFDAETGSVDALLSRADRAMYQAKADGPNSIRLADDTASPG
jgi:diguanylate cyclase (GGDEF)-like protein